MGLIFETIILDICLLPAAILIAIIFHYMDAFNYWKRRNVPFVPPNFPWGNMMLVVEEKQNFGEFYASMYKVARAMNEKFMGFYIFTKPAMVLADIEIIKSILIKDFNSFQGRGLYFDENLEPLSGHLVNLYGPKWRKIRQKVTPTFTSGKMKLMFNTLLKCADELENVIETHVARDQPIDSRDILEKLTINNIGSCVFGLNCDTFKDTDSEFQKYGTMFFESTMSHARKIIIALRFPSLLKLFKVRTIKPEISEFFLRIFKETVQHREATKENRKDFIDLFIKLKNNENIDDSSTQTSDEINTAFEDETLTFNELVAQAFAFFAAGFETSATTINYCLFELAQNQEVQDKLRLEILRVLQKHNGVITYDATMEMQYLEQVINETLRKYPPIPHLTRECNSNYRIPETDVVLEKGTKVWISILGLHTDPEYYPDPSKFDPDRFTKEQESVRNPYVYLPFGDGPRNCIGLRFGYLQVKVALITLLKKFKYHVDPSTKLPVKFNSKGVFLSPNNKIYLMAERV